MGDLAHGDQAVVQGDLAVDHIMVVATTIVNLLHQHMELGPLGDLDFGRDWPQADF